MIQSILVYGILMVITLFIAKKYNYKDASKVALLGGIALGLSLWNYFATNSLELSHDMYSVNFYFVLVARILLGLGLLFFIFKGSQRKRES